MVGNCQLISANLPVSKFNSFGDSKQTSGSSVSARRVALTSHDSEELSRCKASFEQLQIGFWNLPIQQGSGRIVNLVTLPCTGTLKGEWNSGGIRIIASGGVCFGPGKAPGVLCCESHRNENDAAFAGNPEITPGF